MNNSSKKIALFIPCFNEEKRLKYAPFQEFIQANKLLVDFYFIDDGSDDATSEIITNHLTDSESTFLISLKSNYGKGNALREGILKIKEKSYTYFGFIDADLDIPLNQVLLLYNELEKNGGLMAISRRDLHSKFRFEVRALGSIAMVNLANRIIQLKPKIRDTQCGCKLFSREILDVCFEDEFISEWLFDIELFLRLKKKFPNSRESILEVPLQGLERNGKSKFRLRQNLKIFRQLYRINSHYK